MSTSTLIRAFDEMCGAMEPLSGGCEQEFLRFLTDQTLRARMTEGKDQEIAQLKKNFKSEKYKREKVEIMLKHVRAQFNEQFQLREQAENRMHSMLEKVSRFQKIREILCSDLKYSGMVMSDKRLDTFLNDKSLFEFADSTEESTSGTESLSLSVSLTDGSIEVADSDVDQTVLRSNKNGYNRVANRNAAPSKRSSDLTNRSFSKRFRPTDDPVLSKLLYNNIRYPTPSPLPPIKHPIKKIGEFSRPPAMKGRRRPSQQHMKNRYQQGNFLENFYLSSGSDSTTGTSSDTGGITSSTSSTENRPEYPGMYPFALKSPKSPRAMPKKLHTWVKKTVISVEKCEGCIKKIKFGKQALKCRDCMMACHQECQGKASQNCSGEPGPLGARGGGDNYLENYCTNKKIKIPPIVMACVQEVERRAMSEPFIYRAPGSDREVKELVNKFRQGRFPKLEDIADINVVCSALKLFLMQLDEPLVTFNLQSSFIRTAEMPEDKAESALRELFAKLPKGNLDTLAYLLHHLRHVSQHDKQNKMSINSISKIFAQTIIGNAVQDQDSKELWEIINKRSIVVSRMLTYPELDDLVRPIYHHAGAYPTEPPSPSSIPSTPGPESRHLGPISPGTSRRNALRKEKSFFDPPISK